MTKILIIIDSLTCGGAEKSLISLLPFLAKQEYDITLLLVARGGIFEKYVPKNVKIVDFPHKPSFMNRIKFSVRVRLNRGKRHGAEIYWKTIGCDYPKLDQEYDVAIAYQQGFPTFYIAKKVKAKKKYCWINADISAAGYSPSFCKPFYKDFTNIIAVSDVLKEKIVYPSFIDEKDKLITVLDILNEDLIKQMAVKSRPFTKRKGQYHITTVGRLVPPKGYDLAIEAAKILNERGIDFVWHFVGGGPMEQRIRDMIADAALTKNVVVEGEQLNPYPYIANCDIYVQTSKFEGFGITIGEAKILGKPIVSTNFPVIHNQIVNEVNGLIVEMNGRAIADGIIRLIEDETLCSKISEAVRAEHNYTAETESAKVIELIEG